MQGILDCFKDENGLPKRYKQAVDKLKNRDNIIITRADKGGKIVILTQSVYEDKVHNLLTDRDTYETLTKNPLKNSAAEFNKKARKIIGDDLLAKLKVINPQLPYFYGLPKIHKEGSPLRPIISNRNSCTSKISKWLTEILSPFVGSFSNSHIKHSEDFVNKIKKQHIPKNSRLLSLDVVSLFTNVNIEDVLSFLETKLHQYQDKLPIAASKIISLARLCVTTNVFSFKDVYYRQKYGCSMGSNLSPVLANLYMEYFESILLPIIKPADMFWFRYVDDIFTIWDDKWGSFDEFLIKLNSLAHSIKFKVEWEVEGKLPFLDILVIRKPDHLSFSVFRKPTHTGSYLHFFSHHSDKIKYSVASGLFLRALRICSPQYLDTELELIRSQLLKLGYPVWFLTKALSKAKVSFYKTATPNPKCFWDKKTIKIPYNESINASSKMLPNNQIKFTFNYPNSIFKKIVNVHQRTKENSSPGVYKLPCQDCDKVYWGQTGRDLPTRLKEHKCSIRYAQDSSAVFLHSSKMNHRIDWKNAAIIFNSHCSFRRKIVESSLIKHFPNFNISKGQWSPDTITWLAVNKMISKVESPDLTSCQSSAQPYLGQVT